MPPTAALGGTSAGDAAASDGGGRGEAQPRAPGDELGETDAAAGGDGEGGDGEGSGGADAGSVRYNKRGAQQSQRQRRLRRKADATGR